MTYKELYRVLESHGWRYREGGRHRIYMHPDFKEVIPVGRHESQEVPIGTLRKILKAAHIPYPIR